MEEENGRCGGKKQTRWNVSRERGPGEEAMVGGWRNECLPSQGTNPVNRIPLKPWRAAARPPARIDIWECTCTSTRRDEKRREEVPVWILGTCTSLWPLGMQLGPRRETSWPNNASHHHHHHASRREPDGIENASWKASNFFPFLFSCFSHPMVYPFFPFLFSSLLRIICSMNLFIRLYS